MHPQHLKLFKRGLVQRHPEALPFLPCRPIHPSRSANTIFTRVQSIIASLGQGQRRSLQDLRKARPVRECVAEHIAVFEFGGEPSTHDIVRAGHHFNNLPRQVGMRLIGGQVHRLARVQRHPVQKQRRQHPHIPPRVLAIQPEDKGLMGVQPCGIVALAITAAGCLRGQACDDSIDGGGDRSWVGSHEGGEGVAEGLLGLLLRARGFQGLHGDLAQQLHHLGRRLAQL
mmetsp:Transcript_18599/g.52281  ORF Transcript_18599/g.52281 Transcript_18599/m.52281 type:complete len:228 (-) Transcript_18599:499-1182(-)